MEKRWKKKYRKGIMTRPGMKNKQGLTPKLRIKHMDASVFIDWK